MALVLFCVASFTDFLDGYVARKYNQVTDFGKFVDPLADKLLVTSALVLFAEQARVAGWMVCVIIARELIITSLRVVAANKGRVLAATWTGKVKTCVQIGGIIVIYLYYIFIGAVGSGAFDSMTVSSDGSFSATSTVMFLTGTDGYPTFVYFVGWMITLVTIYSASTTCARTGTSSRTARSSRNKQQTNGKRRTENRPALCFVLLRFFQLFRPAGQEQPDGQPRERGRDPAEAQPASGRRSSSAPTPGSASRPAAARPARSARR